MTDKKAGQQEQVVKIVAEPAADTENDSPAHIFSSMRHDPEKVKDLFRNGTYPYKTKIRKAVYEKHKEELQVELLKVQNWVKSPVRRSS